MTAGIGASRLWTGIGPSLSFLPHPLALRLLALVINHLLPGIQDPGIERVFVYAEFHGRRLHVDSALYLVRNQRNRICNIIDQLRLLQRVVAGLAQQQVRLVFDEILLVRLEKSLDLLQIMLLRV